MIPKYKGKKLKDMQRSRDKITELCDTWITGWKQDGTITPSEALLEKIRGLDSKVHFQIPLDTVFFIPVSIHVVSAEV
jgi:hypothetical protein